MGRKQAAHAADPEGPPFPRELAYLWRDYVEIAMGLTQTGMGPPVVTWEALRAWCEFMAVALEPWEVLALIGLSNKRIEIDNEEKPKPSHGTQG